MRDSITFLKEFAKHPTKVGAIAPSSPGLVAAMVDWFDWDTVRTVVEFGPGTGVFTEFKVQHLIVGGGVAANPALRGELKNAATRHGFDLVIAPMKLCTDNAVMGAIALEKIKRGEFATLDLDITAGLQRGF